MSDLVKLKKFVVIPRDALECLTRRYSSLEEAVSEAKDNCAEDGMTVYVVELKAVAARADKPVTVKKL